MQGAEPSQPVGIAAQIGDLLQLREMGLEKRQEATSGELITMNCIGPQGGGKRLDLRLKDLAEGGMGEWVVCASQRRRGTLDQEQLVLQEKPAGG
jgi:hypothetical protein